MTALVFKASVALFASLTLVGILIWQKWRSISNRGFDALVLLTNVTLGFSPFIVLYVFAGLQVTSDVPAYYVPAAYQALGGHLPYRDFATSYGPLFPYVGAAVMSIWDSPKAFALFALMLNTACLLVWHRIARACYQQDTARLATLFYATSGHAIIQCLLGTNQIWVASGVAVSVLLIYGGRVAASGLVQAISVCATKVIALLYWPLLFLGSANRPRWLMSALVPAVSLYAAFALLGADVVYPLRSEGALFSSGNLPYLLEPLIPLNRTRALQVFDVCGGLVLGFALIVIGVKSWRARPADRRGRLIPRLALMTMLFMLVSKKSFTGYALFCLYPIGAVVAMSTITVRKKALIVGVMNLLLCLEPSVWFYLHGNGRSLSEWGTVASSMTIATFVALEICLLALYVGLAGMSYRLAAESDEGC